MENKISLSKIIETFELEVIYEKALEQYRTKGKLYRCLGVLGGMSAALLLC